MTAPIRQYTESERAHFAEMSVVVRSPIYDEVSPNVFMKSLANMIAYSWMQGIKVYAFGHTERMVVDWARNLIGRDVRDCVCEYTGEPYTHILWLDNDHGFDPDLLCQLARHDKDAIGALYYAREGPVKPIAYVKPEEEKRHIGKLDLNDKESYKHCQVLKVPPAVMEVDAIGFGAILMKREIFVNVPEPWFTIDWRAGEDVAFCVKAKEHGYKFYLDGQYILGHLGGRKMIGPQEHEEYRAEHPEEFENMRLVRVGEN